ncbi:hypothetical protein QBC36DRAFT_357299 [Triangularia setosa]|uniref:Uncharacterized protein n=1 Tax=Triangularia setosa TaxID=2587417 RepID=A0AAN7AD75_9PEZI|nr:hypothetical protein QBC36DRAFT_357299 [Podospora setosa]
MVKCHVYLHSLREDERPLSNHQEKFLAQWLRLYHQVVGVKPGRAVVKAAATRILQSQSLYRLPPKYISYFIAKEPGAHEVVPGLLGVGEASNQNVALQSRISPKLAPRRRTLFKRGSQKWGEIVDELLEAAREIYEERLEKAKELGGKAAIVEGAAEKDRPRRGITNSGAEGARRTVMLEGLDKRETVKMEMARTSKLP